MQHLTSPTHSRSHPSTASGITATATGTSTGSSSQRRAWFPLMLLSIASLLAIPNILWNASLVKTSNTDRGLASEYAMNSPRTVATVETAEKHRLLELRLAQMQEALDVLQEKLQVTATTTTDATAASETKSPTTQNSGNSTTTTTTSAGSYSHSLPSCRALMSVPYSQFKDGDFLTSSSAKHIWIPRADGSRQLELTAPCTLHRYTAQEARTCLRGKHISLMGDSLSRYLFLSFAHFIEHGVWPPRFGQARGQFGYHDSNNKTRTQPICPHVDEQGKPTCSPMDMPNIVMEGDWKRGFLSDHDPWEAFLGQIGGGTDGGVFNGHMECDCARSSRSDKKDLCKAECQVENELYISNSASDDENGWGDPARNVSGFSFTKCGATGSCRRDQNTTNFMLERAIEGGFEWNAPLADALQTSLKSVLPPVNIGIYNKGLWGAVSEKTLDHVMPALYNFTGGEEGRCFFRSTTGSPKSLKANLEEHERGLVKKHTLMHGCSFLDFGRLTEDFARIEWREGPGVVKSSESFWLQERNSIYWDVVHFMPWVYEELNNIQLNVLCNAQDGIQ